MGPKDKSDKIDSAKIADFLYRYNGTECVKPYNMPNKTMQRLKALMNERKFWCTAYMFHEQKTAMHHKRKMPSYMMAHQKFSRDIENIELEEQKLLATDDSLVYLQESSDNTENRASSMP